MATPLRLLMLEDNPSDAQLVLHELRSAGYEPTAVRVETEQDYLDHLQPAPEIILSDFTMPELDALRALEIMQERQLDIPFIIVSGTIGEERAVQVMQQGATDYIIKDRLGRLGQAVAHALEKQRMRSGTRLAEQRLAAQHAVTQALAESPTLAAASSRILRTICQSLAWDFGALWQMDDRDNVLRCVDCWRNPLAPFAEFEAITRQIHFAPNTSLPGRVWSSGQPVWIANYGQELTFPRAAQAASAGLHGAFGFPIVLGTEILGVLEFFSREIKQPVDETLQMMLAIGRQLAQYIERKRSEESLRQSNQTLHALIQTTPLAIITLDSRSHVTMWNTAAEEMFGWKEAEVLGQLLPLVPPDQQAAFEKSIRHEVKPDQATAHELHLYHKSSSLVDVNLWTAPVTDAQGAIVGSLGLFVNITERNRLKEYSRCAEAERDRLLQRLQVQIDRMPLAFLRISPVGTILDWNPAAEKIFGYTRAEALGKLALDLIVPASAGKQAGPIFQRLLAGDMAAHNKNENLTKGGRVITCEWFNTPLLTPEGVVDSILCMALDVTERVCLEEQFRQSQKMEAVGQLAAGVAHDFNNLLSIILGYSELLLLKLPAADPGREPLRQIRGAAERAAGLTRQLLAFGRKQILAPVVLDVNSLVTELDKMLRRLIGEDVELITVLHPALGRVKADPGQIEQIIMNLVVNARDAMPTGGRLTLQTGNIVLSAAQVRQNTELPPGPYTVLTVSDTGCGMDEATKSRIFEPFFTTKEVGKGTGLGLATVFGIIQQSGGFIEVESTLGAGSSFRIYVPQVRELTRRKDSDHGLVKVPKGAETILLVEDEDGLRELAQLILETGGYKVLGTRNGGEAVQVCHDRADDIHLLFTDVVMPKMSGRQLADLLAPSRPDMKVLYMSGYTDDTMVRHGIGNAATNFLHKPFTPVALMKKVREVLDATNGQAGAASPLTAAPAGASLERPPIVPS